MTIERVERQDFDGLTMLRGIAAMAVVVLHYYLSLYGDQQANFLGHIIGRGYLAVDLFFILSGFVMAYVYGPELEARTLDARTYWLKRVARLYPVHFVTVMMVLALSGAAFIAGVGGEGFGQNLRLLPTTLLNVHAWGVTPHTLGPNYPSWSISAEFFAYLLFPVVLYPLVRMMPALVQLGASLALFVGLYLTFPVWSAWLPIHNPALTRLSNDFGIIRIVPAFLTGIALLRLYRAAPASSGFLHLAFAGGLFILILVLNAIQAADGWVFPLIAAMIYCVARAEPAVGLLRRKARGVTDALVYLGKISYSIYMVHAVVEIVGEQVLGVLVDEPYPVLILPIWVVSAIPAGALVYHLVEEPARRAVMRTFGAKAASARRTDVAP